MAILNIEHVEGAIDGLQVSISTSFVGTSNVTVVARDHDGTTVGTASQSIVHIGSGVSSATITTPHPTDGEPGSYTVLATDDHSNSSQVVDFQIDGGGGLMAVAFDGASRVELSLRYIDFLNDTRRGKDMLNISITDPANAADLIALVTDVDTLSNAAVQAEVSQITASTGTKATGLNTVQNSIEIGLLLDFRKLAPERPAGFVQKYLIIPAPIAAAYRLVDKKPNTGNATVAALIALLETYLVYNRLNNDGTTTTLGGFTYNETGSGLFSKGELM